MWFFWFILLCVILLPNDMIIFGYILWKHTPKNISNSFGYRTTRSMKNSDTWDFANKYFGKLWWKIGWISLIPFILTQSFTYRKSDNIISIVGCILLSIQIILILVSIFITEKKLKNEFTEDGIRKNSENML